MKIGEFAKKFNTNISTVRYYVNHGLIVPSKKSEHFDFDKGCAKDMETILRYKHYYFSIEEIQLLLFLERTSRFKDDVILDLCAGIMEKKKSELIKERRNLDESITKLQAEIEMLPDVPEAANFIKGIPFSFIPNLYCPHCQVPLKLDSASISDGYLVSGELWCSCGYKSTIKDGILLCEKHYEDTPFKSFKNIESIICMLEDFSSTYRMLVEKSYIYIHNKIEKHLKEPGLILSGPFQFNFLLSFIERLDKKNTYVIVDPSKRRIEKMWKYLNELSCDIVFIAGDLSDVPIRNSSVDVYLDDYSVTNSLFTFNTFSAEKISELLKRSGIVTGVFGSYKKAPKSLTSFRDIQPDFEPKVMTLNNLKYCWHQSGIGMKEVKSIGFTSSSEKDYSHDVPGEQLEIVAYFAEKEKR
ncbi:MAG: MerR family transcriptional regulator [Clostridiales bacterium]|nr:MerR family transcriptional regulator [Clostridiales bacterium]